MTLYCWLIIHDEGEEYLTGVNTDGEKVQAGKVVSRPRWLESGMGVITETGVFELG